MRKKRDGEFAVKDPEYRNPVHRKALEDQIRLRAKLAFAPLPPAPRLVRGGDVSINQYGKTFWGGVVVCDAHNGFEVIDSAVVRMEVDFPYIPGLLGFREVPVLAAAFRRLRTRPEVTIVDAQGTAHPRRFGAACHMGVELDVPAVGCAKSLLCGEVDEPAEQRGGWSPIRLDGDTIGAALRTRKGVKPVFVSPGHRADLPSALSLVLACAPRYRLPEPTRLAHRLVNDARRAAASH